MVLYNIDEDIFWNKAIGRIVTWDLYICQASNYSRCMGRKKLIQLLWLGGGLYVCLVLGKSLWELSRAGGRVVQSQQQLTTLQQEGRMLSDRLKEVQTPDFVEKEARDVLGMQKPGETVLIVPTVSLPPTNNEKQDSSRPLANWEKWISLFRN